MKITVRLHSRLIGTGGIKVISSDGNTLIDGSSVSGGGGTEGDPIDVVGTDGKLNKVPKHSTWAAPSAYPTIQKTVNSATSVLQNSTGLTVSDGTYSAVIDFATLTSKAKNLTLREIDVCDGGTAKKMLVLASAPY